jgi:hypothetical protein
VCKKKLQFYYQTKAHIGFPCLFLSDNSSIPFSTLDIISSLRSKRTYAENNAYSYEYFSLEVGKGAPDVKLTPKREVEIPTPP